jgi:2-polyprenyl-6-hydroxyphenyl methylase/3-demethylubiquinone-9 3-methyltransferase
MSDGDSTLTVTRPSDAFAFGRNWQRYVDRYLDPERIAIASQSLADLIEEDLRGKTFVDLGAGSGLFSLCAHRAGASRVISVDVDPDSVESCRILKERSGDPNSWNVVEASILDPKLRELIPQGDVVYSWGVLHHTGDMWKAVHLAADLVKPGGLFCIAIYNRATDRFLDSQKWLRIKRAYNHAPHAGRAAMRWTFLAYWTARQLYARQNPLRIAREYKRSRGMALMTDLVDWLGGYPYEFASADEVVTFCTESCGLEVVKVLTLTPRDTGNNQFVFRRRA